MISVDTNIYWSKYIEEYFSIYDKGTTKDIADFILKKHAGVLLLRVMKKFRETGNKPESFYDAMQWLVYYECSGKINKNLNKFVKKGFLRKETIKGKYKTLFLLN